MTLVFLAMRKQLALEVLMSVCPSVRPSVEIKWFPDFQNVPEGTRFSQIQIKLMRSGEIDMLVEERTVKLNLKTYDQM